MSTNMPGPRVPEEAWPELHIEVEEEERWRSQRADDDLIYVTEGSRNLEEDSEKGRSRSTKREASVLEKEI